jgi:hopanoid biosynthesis associated protein HpnK
MVRTGAGGQARSPRYVIVTGDDFGFSESVNRAIVRAHRDGILTSCSAMVGAPAFGHAVELARANPGLAVGLHLVLVRGQAVLPPARIPHLVDRDGHLDARPWRAGVRYYVSRVCRAELRDEIEAQFEAFVATGLPLSHVDGHLLMHMHPRVFPVVVELAKRYGAPRIRIPCEEFWAHWRFDRRRTFQKGLWSLIFRGLAGRACRSALAHGLFFPERVYGLLGNGALDEAYWLHLIGRLRGRVNEVYCHPCLDEPGARHGESVERGVRELHALLSDRVRQRLDEAGLQRVTYPEAHAATAG